jgi:Flp pilus assembly protein TadB
MAHRFEIKIQTQRPDSTDQPVRASATSRIKLLLQTFAALLVIATVATIGIAIGTAVAIVIASLVAIALGALLVIGAIRRLRSPEKN